MLPDYILLFRLQIKGAVERSDPVEETLRSFCGVAPGLRGLPNGCPSRSMIPAAALFQRLRRSRGNGTRSAGTRYAVHIVLAECLMIEPMRERLDIMR